MSRPYCRYTNQLVLAYITLLLTIIALPVIYRKVSEGDHHKHRQWLHNIVVAEWPRFNRFVHKASPWHASIHLHVDTNLESPEAWPTLCKWGRNNRQDWKAEFTSCMENHITVIDLSEYKVWVVGFNSNLILYHDKQKIYNSISLTTEK